MKKYILRFALIVCTFGCDSIIPERKTCWTCYSYLTNEDGGNPIKSTTDLCDMTPSDIDKVEKAAYDKVPSGLVLNMKCDPKN